VYESLALSPRAERHGRGKRTARRVPVSLEPPGVR
jgi:hypothetical protein